jgi:Fe-S cluster assembly ATP-binding protein
VRPSDRLFSTPPQIPAGSHLLPHISICCSDHDLHASVDGKEILKGITLTVNAGEVHAVMGPNGSGKSTLAQVLAGHPAYEVTGGRSTYKGEDLLEMEAEERAQQGVFLAFQYPVEIPGVTNAYFLRAAYNEIRKARGLEEVDPMEFLDLVEEKLKLVDMDPAMLQRSVNAGFSGGEKKRNEILQMAVLEPKLAILDETDSGLDIDALRIVAEGVNALKRPDNAAIVVTHYQRLLNYIVPDYVHVLAGGRIIKSGGKELALELEARGYDWVLEAVSTGLRFAEQAVEASVADAPGSHQGAARGGGHAFQTLGFPPRATKTGTTRACRHRVGAVCAGHRARRWPARSRRRRSRPTPSAPTGRWWCSSTAGSRRRCPRCRRCRPASACSIWRPRRRGAGAARPLPRHRRAGDRDGFTALNAAFAGEGTSSTWPRRW